MIKPIAICKNDKVFKHSGNWNSYIIKYCIDNKIPFELVDCYSPSIIDKLEQYSALIWTIQNYVLADILESRSILRIAEKKGLKVFPDQNTIWHFDDKIAEMYLFQSVNAPIPKSMVFYSLEECVEWLSKAEYPIIAKLRSGSGSNNVKMLKNFRNAISYANRMFKKGFNPSPSFIYKAFSKIQSSHDWMTVISRFKRIPEFLNTRRHANQLPIEKGYCFFQEYIVNNGFDIKVVVVEDKLSYFIRNSRKGDFRASGSGDFFYDRKYITKEIIDSAFETTKALGLQCVGYDYVIDKRTGQGKLIEMCYGFDWEAVYNAAGYWDRNAKWHDDPLNVIAEVVKNLINNEFTNIKVLQKI